MFPSLFIHTARRFSDQYPFLLHTAQSFSSYVNKIARITTLQDAQKPSMRNAVMTPAS